MTLPPPMTGVFPMAERPVPRLEPLLPALARFVHDCSGDPAARTVAVTALVAGCWQLAGPGLFPRVPSLLLVHASGSGTDPVDGFAGALVADRGDTGPRVHWDGPFMGGEPADAPAAMTAILRARKSARRGAFLTREQLAESEASYFAAQRTGFGSGHTRRYAAAWHDPFGLLTGRDDRILLRLDGDGDRDAFRTHLLKNPDRLRRSWGYGAGLEVVAKNPAISGSLSPGQWDRALAEGMVGLGLPFLFLPHTVGEAPLVDHPGSLDVIRTLLRGPSGGPPEEPANLPPGGTFEHYGERLRARLRHLPGTFEYLTLRLARQLFVVCLRLAGLAGQYTPGTTVEQRLALARDLYGHALRGLVLGVAGLAWHLLGFDPGIPREKAHRALAYLRGRGTMTRGDFLRATHLAKDERDVLLERLAAEDLVRLDGKQATPATFREFVEALHRRKEFPEPENHWAALPGNGEGSA